MSGWRSLLAGTTLGLISTVWMIVQAAPYLPQIALTSVTPNASVSGTVGLAARADAPGFSTLQFQVSGQPVGPLVTSGACLVTWDTRTFANGQHTVTAVARDAAGASAWAAPVTITISNAVPADATAPVVSLTSPGNANVLIGATTFSAAASDNTGVVGVWFTVDGATVGTEVRPAAATATIPWLSTTVPNGTHVVRAIARDASGNTGMSSPVSVTVRNAGSAGDFNGDNYPDLLFQNTDGRLYVWFMQDAVAIGQRGLTPATFDPAWKVVSVDDFNGDRHADILLQHATTGQVVLWYMNGTIKTGEVVVQPANTPWRVATAADMDGDGDADIVWRLPSTGQVYVWTIAGGAVAGGAALVPGTVDPAWEIAGSFDINRDGRSDLVWRNAATGAIYIWYMNGFTMASGGGTTPAGPVLSWRLRAVADFNQDGHADFIWHHQTTGQLYIWRFNGTMLAGDRYLSPSQVGLTWQVVGGK